MLMLSKDCGTQRKREKEWDRVEGGKRDLRMWPLIFKLERLETA